MEVTRGTTVCADRHQFLPIGTPSLPLLLSFSRAIQQDLNLGGGTCCASIDLIMNMEDIRLDATVSSMLSDLVPRPSSGPNPNAIISTIMNGVVREKLKIIPKNITWQDVSMEVYYAINREFMKPAIKEVDDLLSNGVNVTVYNGQFDMICSTSGTEAWVRRLKWQGLQTFLSQRREPLRFCQPLSLINAYVRSYKNLAFYWILGAGHTVPVDQPCTALYMISSIVESPVDNK